MYQTDGALLLTTVDGSLLDPALVITLGRRAWTADPGQVVYGDRLPYGPGDVVLGSETVRLPAAAVLLFCDEMPGANWMHPCQYVVVELATGAVAASVRSDRPPAFGHLPDTWVVVSDPDGRADLIRP
jgi:hypothetical protein